MLKVIHKKFKFLITKKKNKKIVNNFDDVMVMSYVLYCGKQSTDVKKKKL